MVRRIVQHLVQQGVATDRDWQLLGHPANRGPALERLDAELVDGGLSDLDPSPQFGVLLAEAVDVGRRHCAKDRAE